jgi:PAS domain S-box-containing protein
MALALLMRHGLRYDSDRAKLRASEAEAREYMRAVEQCRVSIVFTGAEGRIEYVNPYFCELTGYSPDEVLGQNPRILGSGRQPARFYREMWATIQAGRIWSGEFCNRRKDGTEYWESAVIAPVTDATGQVEKYVAVKHDITGQKEQAEVIDEALRAANAGNEAKAAFLSVISHELRTPLNHILGPCEFVAEELPEGELKQMVTTAANAATHLTQLVQRILNFSEAGGDTGSMPRLIDDISLWVELALQKHTALAEERGSSIEVSMEETVPESFLVDETALLEIFDGLIDNALKYTKPGPVRIELGIDTYGHMLRLSVIDGGPQLDALQREALFQPFHQVDMSHRRTHDGIGLGLCLCHRYASRCGGSIEAKPDPDGGNRFEFVFPVSRVDEYDYCKTR